MALLVDFCDFTMLEFVGGLSFAIQGIDGASNFRAVGGVASATVKMQRAAVEDFFRELEPRSAVVISRGYDATPMRLSFIKSRLRDVLIPLARYVVQNKTTNEWEIVEYDVYKSRCPSHKLKFGVMEVFMQQGSYVTRGPSGLQSSKTVTCAPCVLAHGNCSCIHAATEMMPGASVAELEKLAESAEFVFLNDSPDSAPSNQRKKSFTSQRLQPLCNVFVNNTGGEGQSISEHGVTPFR